MKRFFLIAICGLAIGCGQDSEDVIPLSDQQYAIAIDHLGAFPEDMQCSIALINGEKTAYFGLIKKGDSLFAVHNQDSVFEIGSLTKLFTSTMLADLLLNEKVELDEEIQKYLPFTIHLPESGQRPITFRMLANHTSGLPRMPDNYAFYPESSHDARAYAVETMQEYLEKEVELITDPGEDYIYSNLGYGVLGYIISGISNRSYEQLLHKIICRPYRMKHTTSDIRKIRSLLVMGKDPEGKTISNYDLGALSPSGGVFSNISDLNRFIHANFMEDTLLALQRAETYGWGNFGVALGWHVLKIGGSNCEWYYHSGGMEGYRSSVYMDTRSKRAVILLSNVSTFHPHTNKIDELAYALLKNEYLKDENNAYCIAPFIELARQKGWGADKRDSLARLYYPENSIHGVWRQVRKNRFVTRTFFPDNKVQTNFTGDREIDVWGYYYTEGDSILFTDIGGAACVPDGRYTFSIQNDTLRFEEIQDHCDGRKYSLLNVWVRSD